MPTERLSMRHIREVLRLHYSVGMSQRTVARSLGLAQGTVSKYVNRTRRAGLTYTGQGVRLGPCRSLGPALNGLTWLNGTRTAFAGFVPCFLGIPEF